MLYLDTHRVSRLRLRDSNKFQASNAAHTAASLRSNIQAWNLPVILALRLRSQGHPTTQLESLDVLCCAVTRPSAIVSNGAADRRHCRVWVLAIANEFSAQGVHEPQLEPYHNWTLGKRSLRY